MISDCLVGAAYQNIMDNNSIFSDEVEFAMSVLPNYCVSY